MVSGELSVVSWFANFQVADVSETHSPFTTHNSHPYSITNASAGICAGFGAFVMASFLINC
jgi:hypothetical protein